MGSNADRCVWCFGYWWCIGRAPNPVHAAAAVRHTGAAAAHCTDDDVLAANDADDDPESAVLCAELRALVEEEGGVPETTLDIIATQLNTGGTAAAGGIKQTISHAIAMGCTRVEVIDTIFDIARQAIAAPPATRIASKTTAMYHAIRLRRLVREHIRAFTPFLPKLRGKTPGKLLPSLAILHEAALASPTWDVVEALCEVVEVVQTVNIEFCD